MTSILFSIAMTQLWIATNTSTSENFRNIATIVWFITSVLLSIIYIIK